MNEKRKLKLGIVIHSNEPETVWNALRLANFSLDKGEGVKIFLLGRGVEVESLDTDKFRITAEIRKFVETGGSVLACGTCLKSRQMEGTDLCPLSSMADLHALAMESDKLLTF
ncbi:MAG: DsrE family protein [Leptospirales bacterium]|nr:DsrE family protein [Leptospirales bacterium]